VRPSLAGPPALLIEAAAWLGTLALVLALALATAPLDGLWGGPALLALFLYAAAAFIALRGLVHHAPLRRFGIANVITAARAAAAAFIAGLALIADEAAVPARSLAVVIGGIALFCDGLDGWAARRTGLASRFGARFDMEVDALFTLIITFMLLRVGQVAAWVLAVGLIRYIFVLAGWLWPPLARPLPPSTRRKAACVAVILALLAALTPCVDPPAAGVICAAGLAMLIYSFATDCLWLVRYSRAATAPQTQPCRPEAA